MAKTKALCQSLPQINGGIGGGGTFSGRAGPVFDLLSAADVAADLTLSALLHPQRATRLVEFHRRDPDMLGLKDVLDAVEGKLFTPVEEMRHQAISETVRTRFVSALIALSVHMEASDAVRAISEDKLYELTSRLSNSGNTHDAWLSGRIEAHLGRGIDQGPTMQTRTQTPPGSPIGSGIDSNDPAYETCWHCD